MNLSTARNALLSVGRTKYEVVDGVLTLIRLPAMNFINDKDGNPVGINKALDDAPTKVGS